MSESLKEFLEQGLMHYAEAKSTIEKFEEEVITLLRAPLAEMVSEGKFSTPFSPTKDKISKYIDTDDGPYISVYIGGKWANQDNYFNVYVWWRPENKKPTLGVGFSYSPKLLKFAYANTSKLIRLDSDGDDLVMDIDGFEGIHDKVRQLVEAYVLSFLAAKSSKTIA